MLYATAQAPPRGRDLDANEIPCRLVDVGLLADVHEPLESPLDALQVSGNAGARLGRVRQMPPRLTRAVQRQHELHRLPDRIVIDLARRQLVAVAELVQRTSRARI